MTLWPRPSSPPQTPATPARVPLELRLDAAGRLLGEPPSGKGQGAKRMLAAAAAQGIDLSQMWATFERDASGRATSVRHVALMVPGTGKTAMLLVSHPRACGPDAEPADRAERAACIDAACAHAASPDWTGPPIRLAQALPDPQEIWAVDTFLQAGFRKVGELAYLRRPMQGVEPTVAPDPVPEWPEGVSVRPVMPTGVGDGDRARLIAALERSYINTLDCPELCGLRETGDVLDSHQSTGEYDPSLWWLVFWRGEPHGCMLISHTPEMASAELVYLGLSPEIRGKGLGRRLLEMGVARARRLPIEAMMCAVDLRNAPARRLYARLGFQPAGRRTALVRPLGLEPR